MVCNSDWLGPRLKLTAIIRHLRLRPFPSETAEGRASERYRRALWTIITNLINRGLGMLLMVLSVSWTIPYLGEERFGAWITIGSFTAMLSFLDLGVGNALTNRIARVSGSESAGRLSEAISGGLTVLAFIAVLMSFVLTVLALMIPWQGLLQLSTPEIAQEVRTAALTFALLFSVSIFANGVARIFHGMQQGFEVYLIGALGLLAGLLALSVATESRQGIPVLLACAMGGPILGNLLLLMLLRKRGQLPCRGAFGFGRREIDHLLKVGGLFFLLQIGTMVGWGADSLIIAAAQGAAAVAAFGVVQRLTQIVLQPLAIMNAPLWAAYADADVRADRAFIKATFIKSIVITFSLALVGAVTITLFGDSVIRIWTDGEVSVPGLLLLAMSVWMIIEATGGALGILLNGLGVVREQVWIVIAFILLVLPLKLWLAHSIGAVGVVVAGISAYLLVNGLGYGVIFRRRIEKRVL